LNARSVFVDSTKYPTVNRSIDLDQLRHAERILVPGVATITLRGDEVSGIDLTPVPDIPGAGDLFKQTRSRDDVFGALRRLLDENPGARVRAVPPGSPQVLIDPVESDEMALLMDRDLWQAGFRDWQGWWAVKLYFENGILRRIVYMYSPIEFF
jgi:hypothetical protein